jgi:hypothetical protein
MEGIEVCNRECTSGVRECVSAEKRKVIHHERTHRTQRVLSCMIDVPSM